jgi:hypothetical protein
VKDTAEVANGLALADIAGKLRKNNNGLEGPNASGESTRAAEDNLAAASRQNAICQ